MNPINFVENLLAAVTHWHGLQKITPVHLTDAQKANLKAIIASSLAPVIKTLIPQIANAVSAFLGGSAPVGALVAEVLQELAQHLMQADAAAQQQAAAQANQPAA